MKKLASILLSFSLFSNGAFADCDWSKIQKNNDSTYTYSRELNLCVGEMKQDLEISKQQNEKYLKAITLKDLTITKADKRADLWMQTSFKLEDRIQTIDKMQSTNKWLYFGLGVVTMFAATYAAGQVINNGR